MIRGQLNQPKVDGVTQTSMHAPGRCAPTTVYRTRYSLQAATHYPYTCRTTTTRSCTRYVYCTQPAHRTEWPRLTHRTPPHSTTQLLTLHAARREVLWAYGNAYWATKAAHRRQHGERKGAGGGRLGGRSARGQQSGRRCVRRCRRRRPRILRRSEARGRRGAGRGAARQPSRRRRQVKERRDESNG